MLRRVRQLRGPALVDAVLGKFEGMIADLTRGIQECQERVTANEDAISVLEAENSNLRDTGLRAHRVADNLRNLLGEGKRDW